MPSATDQGQIYQSVRLGLETTQGTGVVAAKRLQSIKITSKPKAEISTYKASGSKYTNISALDAEWDEPDGGGQLSYPELPYLLAGAVQKTTGALASGGAAASYDWTFTPNTYSQDSFAAFTVDYGDEVRNETASGNVFKSLGFTFPRRGQQAVSVGLLGPRFEDDKLRYLSISGTPTAGDFAVTVNGQTTTDIAYDATAATIQTALEALSNLVPGDVVVVGGPINSAPVRVVFTGLLADADPPTVTVTSDVTGGTARVTRLHPSPTEIAQVPLTARHVDVYLATTYAGLAGASRALRVFNHTWNLGDRNDAIWEFNTSIPSFADTIEGEPKGEVSLTVGSGSNVMNLLIAAYRRSEPIFLRQQAVGPLIEAGFNHTLRIDSCLRMTDAPSEKKAAGQLVSRDFKLGLAHDATWGQAFSVFVRTSTAAL
jgi:hypothetical protein